MSAEGWVRRRIGGQVTSKVYHSYDDCGMLRPLNSRERLDHEAMAVDEHLITLLGLKECQHCVERSTRLSLREVVARALTEDLGEDGADAIETADAVLRALAENGYEIIGSRREP